MLIAKMILSRTKSQIGTPSRGNGYATPIFFSQKEILPVAMFCWDSKIGKNQKISLIESVKSLSAEISDGACDGMDRARHMSNSSSLIIGIKKTIKIFTMPNIHIWLV